MATTTEIYFTFSQDPIGLTVDHITVVGATKGVLSGTGLTRTLTISNITVANAAEITVSITNPANVNITPTVRSVVVYVDGEFTTLPFDFLGYSLVEASSVSIEKIEFQDGLELGESPMVPYAILANVVVNVNGVRLKSTKDISAYRHGHVEWEVTYANGDPVEYEGEIKKVYSPTDIVEVNPYTDTIGSELSVPIRKAGTYKVKAKVWFAAANGGAVYAESERNVTFSPSTQTSYYFAGALGDNANDGRDPNGFVGPFDYEEATGIVSKVGAFTSYDHTVATSYGYEENNTNVIWIDGARRIIAEKISNDAIRLDDAYKLGADATGLMSSTGPKSFLTDVSVVNGDNIAIYLLVGQEHEFNSKIGITGRSGQFIATSYGGIHASVTATLPANEEIFDFAAPPSTSTYPSTIFIGCLNNKEVPMRRSLIGGVENSDGGLAEARCMFILDRPLESNMGGYYTPTFHIKRHQLYWGMEYNKYGRQVSEVRTISATLDGQDYIDLDSPFDAQAFQSLIGTTSTRVAIKVYNEGYTGSPTDNWLYRAGTIDFTQTNVTRIYLEQHRNVLPTLPVLAEGTTVVICENRGNLLLLGNKSPDDRFGFVGNILEHECDLETYDHYLYSSLKSNHQHYAWNYARAGKNVGYMFNANNDSGYDVSYHVFHDNYASNCTNMFDTSNEINRPEDGVFKDIVLLNNIADETVSSNMLFTYCALSLFAKNNKQHGADKTFPMMFAAKTSTSIPLNELFTAEEIDWVIENNDSYGSALWGPSTGQHISIEAYNNRCQHNGTSVKMLYYNTTDAPVGTEYWFGSNTIFTPNHITGESFTVDGDDMALAEFELLTGSENNNTLEPDWIDGVNGDFASNSTPVWAGGETLLIEPVVGQAFTLDLTQYFNGPDLTISIVQSELPTGLTLSNNTISGTPIDGGGTLALVIRATNVHGFVDSPEIKFLNRYDSSVRMTTILANENWIDMDQVDLVEGDEVEFDWFFDENISTSWPRALSNLQGFGNDPSIRVVQPGSGNSSITAGSGVAAIFINEEPITIGALGGYVPYRDIATRLTWRVVVGAAGISLKRLLCKNTTVPTEFSGALSICNLRIKPRTPEEILVRLNSGGLHNETEEAEIGDLTVTYKNTTSANWA